MRGECHDTLKKGIYEQPLIRYYPTPRIDLSVRSLVCHVFTHLNNEYFSEINLFTTGICFV